MFGFGVGGVNLGKVAWGVAGENRTEQVKKKKKEVSFSAIFANWVELLELEFTTWGQTHINLCSQIRILLFNYFAYELPV